MISKLIASVSFYFFKVITRKFYIIYITHIIFLLDSTDIDDPKEYAS